MRRLVIGIFFLSGFVARAFAACQCDPQTAEDLRDQAMLIFSATVSEIQTDKKTGEKTIVFDVIDTFKGETDMDVKLTDSRAGTDCDLGVKEKEHYLVYARWEWGAMITNRCIGTKKLEQADADTKIIGPSDSWKSEQYPNLKKACMGHDGAFCCLRSVDAMAKGGFLPENPETGCPSGLVPDRLKCGGSLRWCIPAS